jgi:hypothetical protein
MNIMLNSLDRSFGLSNSRYGHSVGGFMLRKAPGGFVLLYIFITPMMI